MRTTAGHANALPTRVTYVHSLTRFISCAIFISDFSLKTQRALMDTSVKPLSIAALMASVPMKQSVFQVRKHGTLFCISLFSLILTSFFLQIALLLSAKCYANLDGRQTTWDARFASVLLTHAQ
jgi:hypothetical protein